MSRKERGRGLALKIVSMYRYKNLKTTLKSSEDDIALAKTNAENRSLNRIKRIRKPKKKLYGHYKPQTSEISHKKSCTWLRMGNLERDIESVLIPALKNSIWTNYVKARIDKMY